MLVDSFNRKINYMRVSVTSRCNFRCLYCMPNTPFSWEPKENVLSYEDMFEFIKIAIDSGIDKIRLTGGEPLVRKDIDKFIRMISTYAPNIDLALTTNGYFLDHLAPLLKEAGLKRVNISLDSLRQDTYLKIAQKDVLYKVLNGIEASLSAGLGVKLNVVILKDVNDMEISDLYQYAKKLHVPIRFIEYMENSTANANIQGVSSQYILDELSSKHNITELPRDNSPAVYYKDEDGYVFGLIKPHDDEFCKNCNRIRLTAEGYLIPCLYFDESYQIKQAIQDGDIKKASEILQTVIQNKPEKNDWTEHKISNRAFYETGG
ncbi:MAG: GTP 3',8-cyclase MoaA [Epsilonproteobacteria bacterium]|nr:GTP 3',8-cyclase MoaA [Campylobacterota bacterium]